MKQDVYQKVTDKIIADLEKGELTWLRPWNAGNTDGRIIRPQRHNGMGYNGINILMLWSAALEHGFQSPFWMTFNQAKEFGAHVRKGEAGSLVVYANTITKSEEQEDGTEVERKIPFMKGYTVFNVEQIEGVPVHFDAKPEPMAAMLERIAHADAFFAATRAVVRHGGNSAHYIGGTDHVQMPSMPLFRHYHLTVPIADLPPKTGVPRESVKRRPELVPALIVLPYGMAMRSPLIGLNAFEKADDLTGCGPASISCPRQFALLTRVGHDTVPCAPGFLVRRYAPTPTTGDRKHGTQERNSNL